MTNLCLSERLRALYRRIARWWRNEAHCHQCERVVSYETGFTLAGTLSDDSEILTYCPDCAPPQSGTGYTLTDIQQIRWRPDGNPQRQPLVEGETVTRVIRVTSVTHEAGLTRVVGVAEKADGAEVEPEDPYRNSKAPRNSGAPGSDGA